MAFDYTTRAGVSIILLTGVVLIYSVVAKFTEARL